MSGVREGGRGKKKCEWSERGGREGGKKDEGKEVMEEWRRDEWVGVSLKRGRGNRSMIEVK